MKPKKCVATVRIFRLLINVAKNGEQIHVMMLFVTETEQHLDEVRSWLRNGFLKTDSVTHLH